MIMSDNKNVKDYKDKTRINVNEPYEVAYWTKKWNITAKQLTDAVRSQDTTSVKKIEEFLKKK